MRSDALLAAAAALHFAAAPAARATESHVLVHVCGSDATIPLNLPPKGRSDGQAPCHGGAMMTAEKKKGRGAGG